MVLLFVVKYLFVWTCELFGKFGGGYSLVLVFGCWMFDCWLLLLNSVVTGCFFCMLLFVFILVSNCFVWCLVFALFWVVATWLWLL